MADVGATAAVRGGLALGSKTVSWQRPYVEGESNMDLTARKTIALICWTHMVDFITCELELTKHDSHVFFLCNIYIYCTKVASTEPRHTD